MKDILEQCVRRFKAEKGFDRLLQGMLEKYRSFGTVKGTVVLNKAKPEEKEAISGFLKKNYLEQKDISVSTAAFRRALRQTPYHALELDDIVRTYFGNEIVTKREEKSRKNQEEQEYFQEIIAVFAGTDTGKWLEQIMQNKPREWSYLHQHYRNNKEQLKEALTAALNGGNHLPAKTRSYQRIAVFAAETTGDPHAFDNGRVANWILFQYICSYFQEESVKLGAQAQQVLFNRAGIIKDDLLNHTCVFGISCVLKDGKEHPGTSGYFRNNDPMIMTLQLLLETVSLITKASNKVYIVENSGVFAQLAADVGERPVSLVCTSGQLTTASLFLLDMLQQQEKELYYAGDFDPEGLQIADKLKTRYKKLKLWHYTEVDYVKCYSAVPLSEQRLAKLNSLQSPELKQIAVSMRQQKVAGYQEKLLETYRSALLEAEDITK